MDAIVKWLKKKESPTKLGGNIRIVDAWGLLRYIKRNYTLIKKTK